jgi:hypothetical protein
MELYSSEPQLLHFPKQERRWKEDQSELLKPYWQHFLKAAQHHI